MKTKTHNHYKIAKDIFKVIVNEWGFVPLSWNQERAMDSVLDFYEDNDNFTQDDIQTIAAELFRMGADPTYVGGKKATHDHACLAGLVFIGLANAGGKGYEKVLKSMDKENVKKAVVDFSKTNKYLTQKDVEIITNKLYEMIAAL